MSPDSSEILTIQEVSKVLKIPVGSIYQMTFRKQIPFFKINNRLRFVESEVIDYFKKKEIQSND